MRLSFKVLAAAAVVSLSLGGVSTAAVATPGAGHGHHLTGGSHTHAGHGVVQGQKKLARDIARVSKLLAQHTRTVHLRGLDELTVATIAENVALDQDALAALATDAADALTAADLVAVRDQLKLVRPTNYLMVVKDLREAGRISAVITEAYVTYVDDPTATAVLDEAQVLVDTAVADALAITATSTSADVKAVKPNLQAARALVDGLVDDETDGDTTTTDPSTDTTGTTAP